MNKIIYRLWAGMMILILLVSASIWIFQFFFLKDYYISNKIKTVSTKIYTLVNGLDLSAASETYKKLDTLAYSENIGIEIIDSEKNTIYISTENPDSTYEQIDLKTDSTMKYNIITLGKNNSTAAGTEKTYKFSSGAATSGSGSGSNDGSSSGTGSSSSSGTGSNSPDSGSGAGSGSGGSSNSNDGSGSGYGSKGYGIMPDDSVKDDLIDDALAGEEATNKTVNPRYGFEILVLSVPFQTSDGKTYAALTSIPVAPIEEMIFLMNRLLLVITAAMILMSLIISYLMANSLSKPVKKLTAAAEEISSGNLDIRTNIKRKDELGILGSTFNKMAEKLQITERLRKELIENVSHELRTPLSIINGYAETIRDVTGDNKDRRDAQLNIISDESRRLGVMIDDILDYSQMQSGFMTLNKTRFDIIDLIKNIIKKYDIILAGSNLKILFNNHQEIQVYGDVIRIEQVVQNLLKNAINYSPDGRNVEVEVEDIADRVKVKITNYGIGIPEEEISSIWERYYRTKGIKKRKIYGSGLGLSIVKSILDAHEVNYFVTSNAKTGTTFWFELSKTN